MRNVFFLGAVALLLLSSCGKNRTPNDTIQKVETRENGFKPNGIGNPPIPIIDTSYGLSITWGQANYYASRRGDRLVWVIIGIVLLVAAGLAIRFLEEMDPKLKGVIVWACLAGSLVSFKWQSAGAKWNNDKVVPKAVYDKAMKEAGSTRPIWDSLERECCITWGPYNCYQ